MKSENVRYALMANTVWDADCLRWTGYRTDKGYGYINVDGKSKGVHRAAYEALVGPIPAGLQIDHVAKRGCKFRDCTNPQHLEPVTGRENVLRSTGIPAQNAAKTHCPQGHPLTLDNIQKWQFKYRGVRACRTCKNIQTKKYKAAAKALRDAS